MAATTMLFVGWNMPRIGHESEAVEHFGTFLNYLNQQQRLGAVESVEPVMLTPWGGNLSSFVIIRAEPHKLHELRRSETFVDHVTRGNFLVENLMVIEGWTGDGVRNQMARYQRFVLR